MDFKALFYAQSYDRKSIVERLDGLLRTESHILNIIPFASAKPPLDCFGPFDSNRTFSCAYSQNGLTLFNLRFKSPQIRSETPVIEGKFFIYEHPTLPDTYLLISIEAHDFMRRALLPFIERSYPRIFFTFIGHKYMKLLLRQFRDNHNFTDLKVVNTVLRHRFSGQKTRRETFITSVNWHDLGLDGAFDYAQEQNGWFHSITFEALKNYSICAEITLARNGIIKTNGQFLAVFNSLVSPIVKTVHDNYELFKMRGRRDNPSLDVRPLTINFGRDQLVDKEERDRLVDTMRLLERVSLSVIHYNPYLQLSLIDYRDGSTFDLWVLNPRELIIVPQLKGTVSAIRRLVSHVFDNYAEGQVEDFQLVRQ
jgi:hypothetical protein